ncbi:ribokinase [Microbispora bryophytorum]|uniref:Ribokinase n=1 Tax=Microbispora bryophytorum TaxID=1460882 RepID=A0A8H9H2Y7_9ACTN|nr:ribokinase [Microbispora bryophytorum]MBD3137010.1 ribokinase [Microbispora bryophytorum]TQS07271.1 ribokinase [Microbispora bryophytorum]GGO14016.1 ribokinase [Microbispora bryophytorum]
MISVFGSANMDLVAYVAQAPRPGETVTGREFRTVPGGKGANQAIAAARAGAGVAFLGAVGDDAFGPGLRAALAEAGVDTAGLRVVPGPSGVAHIVVEDGGDNSIIVVPGANGAVTGPAGRDAETIARSDALLLQLELPMDAVVAAAHVPRGVSSRAEVILTPAPAAPLPAELLEAVDLIVPNEHEAAALTGRDDPRDALEALLGLVPEAVVTLGARGALYGSRDGTRLREAAVPVRAVDTTAAGDTFAGALAVARTEGAGPARALRFASAAAALSVQREGASTSMPHRHEIDRLLEGL